MTDLRTATIRLAHEQPKLRTALLHVIAEVFPNQKKLNEYLHEHPKADKSLHSVKETKHSPKKPPEEPSKGGVKVTVDKAQMDARKPKIESPDLKKVAPDAKVEDLPPEIREEIKGYNIDVVGNDARQAVEIARKLKKGIEKSADVCKLSPPVCKGNMGLTRDKMPQIEGDKTVKQMLASDDPLDKKKGQAMVHAGADPESDKTVVQHMLEHFEKNGVKSAVTKVPVGALKATQKEIQAGKTFGMASAHLTGKNPNTGEPFSLLKGGNKILVSRDGHILDGHHRWAAALTIDPELEMDVQVIDMDMKDLLREAQSIPGVYKADIGGDPLDEAAQKKYKADAKTKWKTKVPKHHTSHEKNYGKSMESVMDKHDLTDDDAEQILDFKKDRPRKGKPQPPAELMRRFLQKAKPETKKRMEGVSPTEFVKMLGVIFDDEDLGGGKAASIRTAAIHLAFANPALRTHILPMLRVQMFSGGRYWG